MGRKEVENEWLSNGILSKRTVTSCDKKERALARFFMHFYGFKFNFLKMTFVILNH